MSKNVSLTLTALFILSASITTAVALSHQTHAKTSAPSSHLTVLSTASKPMAAPAVTKKAADDDEKED